MPSSLPVYHKLDQPEVLQALFHPRPETADPHAPNIIDLAIEVDKDIRLGAGFHLAGLADPNILFFHGNGETVSDYDTIGPMYNEQGLNFLSVDYRGYGRSDGTPTVTTMMRDAHAVLRQTRGWLQDNNYTGPLIIMGRSLGSACALELAAAYHDDIAGLIIESGFSTTIPLLLCLGVDVEALHITEADGFNNISKISRFSGPTFILHGQYDRIIPLTNAELLQTHSPARSKEFQMVPGADHNTVISRAGKLYFAAIKRFTDKIRGIRPTRRRRR